MSGELDSFFANLPERAGEKDLTGVRASYVFAAEDDGAWTVRIADGKVEVSEGASEGVDCTISASEETFAQLLNRELSAFPAYLSGRLKLDGDLGAAMRLQKLL